MRQDRFEKLFTFLLALPDAEFNFQFWGRCPSPEDVLRTVETGQPACGTVGCAAGWLPAADPDHWRWLPISESDRLFLGLRSQGEINTSDQLIVHLAIYFEVDEGLAEALFMPTTQEWDPYEEDEEDGCEPTGWYQNRFGHTHEQPNEDCTIPDEEFRLMTPRLWVERAERILAKVPSETP
jgi:hypothetical protein